MVVNNYIAKLNDNNCANIISYMNQGLTATESFTKELKKNRHNPKLIKGFERRNDKYFWIFAFLEEEMNEQKIQCIETC